MNKIQINWDQVYQYVTGDTGNKTPLPETEKLNRFIDNLIREDQSLRYQEFENRYRRGK